MTAFAEITDLETRLGSEFDPSAEDQVTAILDDAAAFLRSIIGSQVYPEATSTITLYQHAGDTWLTIPLSPVTEIVSASVDGVPADLKLIDGAVRVCGPAEVELTVKHGYTAAPDELVAWNCVLASQVLGVLGELGTLGAGEVSSVGVDDYRKSFKQQSDKGAFSLPDRVIDMLRSKYGRGVEVVGFR